MDLCKDEKTKKTLDSLCENLDSSIQRMWKDENNGRHHLETYERNVRNYLRELVYHDKKRAQDRYNPLNIMGRMPGFSPIQSVYNRIANEELYNN